MRWAFTSSLVRLVLGSFLLFMIPVFVRAEGDVSAARPYQKAVQQLEAFIEREVKVKGIPALSIALVDDQKIVWARGFGSARPGQPATAETVYRVGSVSKLFTDLAIMQLVERGALDLKDPVTRHLRDFKPTIPYPTEITLQHLMSHRSGLVREPPEGNYFDPTTPSLERTVRSLNDTTLVYRPGKRTKYSNAGIAVVGLVLERTQKQRFPRYLGRVVLHPLGMDHSSFEPTAVIRRNLAQGVMWTYHGREFPAPTFELGMAPAGSLYSTVKDLSLFIHMLLADGKGKRGVVIQKKTLQQMWTPQFVKPGTRTGFGIGFAVSTFEGRRRVGHGGAVYGFSTELAVLPDDRLGVVVISARDVTNAVTRHIANEALRQMLAVRQKKPSPRIPQTTPVPKDLARKLAGRYQSGTRSFDLVHRDGKLWLFPDPRGMRVALRQLGKNLIVDGRLSYGQRIVPREGKLQIGKSTYQRVEVTRPAPAPERWKGLIGEYGWDHNTLYILERQGQLHALIEWVFLYPLKEIKRDVFAFPDYGLYHGEKLIFSRDKSGQATQVEAASVRFKRRPLVGASETFRIRPVRPLAELRKQALKATPPVEKGTFRKPQLVNLARLSPTLKFDIRYAGNNNFLGIPLYTRARAFMQRPAAQALLRVHRKLAKQGYGLLIFDAYRPWHVTRMFWDATPAKLKHFVADPSKGSRHNRGCAVDLTLYDLKTGKPVPMVAGFDEFTDRAYPDYPGGTSRQRYHRDLLRRSMEAENFSIYEAEWWHFDYKDWRKYPILNFTFEEIEKQK